jgi:predicted Zn-dependent peptidase
MINFEKYKLANGLTVILHQDKTTPIAAVNITYNVGSRDENPNRTGFAHLFEHLMFGGSKHIPKYDTPLQNVGGENNAFTNVDITNYYLTLPVQNLETAFWLESDRMNELAFSQKSLDVQRSVVIEEFKQNYLNQPYGDAMLLLKPLVYKVHPYQWNTIGKSTDHITEATMEEVKAFFYQFYRPNNAVLTVAGDLEVEKTKSMTEKWFGQIPQGMPYVRNLPQEPVQNQARKLEVERPVPIDSLYKAYRMGKRTDDDFYAVDLISDLLGTGQSSRLQQRLVQQKQVFSSINVYVSGTFDDGLLIINGHANPSVSLAHADEALQEELEHLKTELINQHELQKVKNKVKTVLSYSELLVQDKALNLGIAEVMCDADLFNTEWLEYDAVSVEDILESSRKIIREESCSTLYYRAE